MPARTVAVTLAIGFALGAPGCGLTPWGDKEVITAPDPAVPPIRLETMNGRRLVVMRVPTGGWTLGVDRAEVTPEGRRVFVTVRRPDPAFMHTQAFVDLRALTDVPESTPIEVVARVLDRHERPDGKVYARAEPVAEFDE